MKKYQATWLRGREPSGELIGLGMDETAARQWLERAITDRGIVAIRPADPSADLFRLPHVVRWEKSWRPNVETIAWPEFTILAPYADRRGLLDPFPIEVSRELLIAAAPGHDETHESHRRYASDGELVAEAVKAIKSGLHANANQAAIAFAADERAEGTSQRQIADRLGRKIKAALGG